MEEKEVKKPLQVYFSDKSYEDIELIVKYCRKSCKADAIRQALKELADKIRKLKRQEV